MRRLAKNFILATAVVGAIFIVDLSGAEAASLRYEAAQRQITEGFFLPDIERQNLDFWTKFRDTVMPDPDEPQNNNPPKKEDDPEAVNPKPEKPPKVVVPKPAPPPKVVKPKPAD